jgi:hypothetical protein
MTMDEDEEEDDDSGEGDDEGYDREDAEEADEDYDANQGDGNDTDVGDSQEVAESLIGDTPEASESFEAESLQDLLVDCRAMFSEFIKKMDAYVQTGRERQVIRTPKSTDNRYTPLTPSVVKSRRSITPTVTPARSVPRTRTASSLATSRISASPAPTKKPLPSASQSRLPTTPQMPPSQSIPCPDSPEFLPIMRDCINALRNRCAVCWIAGSAITSHETLKCGALSRGNYQRFREASRKPVYPQGICYNCGICVSVSFMVLHATATHMFKMLYYDPDLQRQVKFHSPMWGKQCEDDMMTKALRYMALNNEQFRPIVERLVRGSEGGPRLTIDELISWECAPTSGMCKTLLLLQAAMALRGQP